MVDDGRLAGEEDDFTRWDETIFDRCLSTGFNPFRSAAVRRQSSCGTGTQRRRTPMQSRACHLTPKMRGADVEPLA